MINFFLKISMFLCLSAYFTITLFASPNSSDLPDKNKALISVPFSVSYNNMSFTLDHKDFDESVEEDAIITVSYLNRQFIAIMSAAGINIISSLEKQDLLSEIPGVSKIMDVTLKNIQETAMSDSDPSMSSSGKIEFENIIIENSPFDVTTSKRMPSTSPEKIIEVGYLFSPYLKQFELLESERSGFFFTLEVIITVLKYSDGGDESGSREGEDFSLKAIGSGSSEDEALNIAIDNIIAQFEIFLSEFEEWSGGLKIIDIYQGTIVINKGKIDGIKKGDFLRSSNYLTGKTTGEFIVERTEDDISYVRSIWQKQEVTPGDFLEKYNYLGMSLSAHANYLIGTLYSGFSTGVNLLWSRWLYVFYPYLGGEYLSVSGERFEKIDVYMPYIGVKMVRDIGYFTVFSSISCGLGYASGTGIKPGWEYVGTHIKLGGDWRINRRFSVGIDVGYSYYHSLDIFNAPSIAGFSVGGGGKINF